MGEDLALPRDELQFRSTLSGGPGGRHANATRTRVTVWFDLRRSRAFDPTTKARLAEALAGRLGQDGRLRVSCGRHRSQAANRREALGRLGQLLLRALAAPPPRRKATRPSRAARRRRLEEKRRRAEVKRGRRRPALDEAGE